ncbi:MAG TPA: SGNH/GDSL hydrolase family protein [Ktedonobacterales bacterium]|nr:SGNH/GDSL hydrolase family protein [Ktedonobacterales bacterium]
MAFALVQSAKAGGNSGASASATFGSATAAGNLLVLIIVATKNPGDVDFTPPSGWSQAGSTVHDDVFISLSGACFYYANNPGGITSVATTISAAVSGWDVYLLEFSGVATSSPLDAANLASAVGTGAHSVSATMAQIGDLLVGFALLDEAATTNTLSGLGAWTALTGQQDGGGWAGVFPYYMTASGSGSQSFAPTYSGNSDGVIGIAGFIAASGSSQPLTAQNALGVGIAANASLSVAVALSAQNALGKGIAQNASLGVGAQLVAQAALGKAIAQNAALHIISLPPPPMPRISLNAPAFASNITYAPSRANNSTYGDFWRSVDVPSVGSPIWIALDLSGVSSSQRATILVNLLNEEGNFYLKPDGSDATSLFTDYKLQGNAAAGGGGSAPSSGWVDLVGVTGNLYPTRQHILNFTGYNWLRLIVTASTGTSPNNDVQVQIDVHDAHLSAAATPNPEYDAWLFLGDSITNNGMLHPEVGGGDWGYGGPVCELVNSGSGGVYYPATVDGGNVGETMTWAATNIAGLLANFNGSFIVLAFGTNDANQAFEYTQGDSNVLSYYNALLTVLDACLALGVLVIIPYVPYGSNNGGDLGYNTNLFNQYVDAHLPTDRLGGWVRGPDFWTFFEQNPNLLQSDGIHPTYVEVGGAASGYERMHALYANWMLTNIYAVVPISLTAQAALGVAVAANARLAVAVALTAQASLAVGIAHTARLVTVAPPPSGVGVAVSGGPSGVSVTVD